MKRLLDHYLHTAVHADRLLEPGRAPLELGQPVDGAVIDRLDSTDAALRLVRQRTARAGRRGPSRRAVGPSRARVATDPGHGDLPRPHRLLARTGRRHRDLARGGPAPRGRRPHPQPVGPGGPAARPGRRRARTPPAGSGAVRTDRRRPNRPRPTARWASATASPVRWRRHWSSIAGRWSFPRARQPRGQAASLNNLGYNLARLGEYAEALLACQEALTLARKLGNRKGEAHCTDSLAYIHRGLGEHEQAIEHYHRAARCSRRAAPDLAQAEAWTSLGDTYAETDQHDAARDAWQFALEIHEHLDHPTSAALADASPPAIRHDRPSRPRPPWASGIAAAQRRSTSET